MNAIYRLLEIPNGPLLLFLFIIFTFGVIAVDIYIVCLLRKRIQEGKDTSDIWFSLFYGILVELMLFFNIANQLYDLLKYN